MLSKSQARAFFLGGTGIFTAAFLALTFDTHKQVPQQTNEQNLTPQVVRGKQIWEDNNCMGCHTLFGEGAYYAPELTKVIERRGEPWIRLFMKDTQAMFPGERKMVQYDFNDEDMDALIAFFKWCGEVDLNGFPADPPLAASLSPVVAGGVEVEQPKVFTDNCAACHSVGGKGGRVGPPLDRIGHEMARGELTDWIADPQSVRPGTAMPKMPLDEAQLEEVVTYLLTLSGKE